MQTIALRPHSFTAFEFFAALEPHKFSTQGDIEQTLEKAVRRAHVVAVLSGYGWNPEGRYPVAIWMALFS